MSTVETEETETLDRLYLEWSQFTTARTGREVRLLAALELAWDWINNEGVMDRVDRQSMEAGVVETIADAILSAKRT